MAKKNNASLTMNKATPMFIPLCTAKVWLPKYVASLIMSLNQKDIEEIINASAINTKLSANKNPCIAETTEVVRVNKETDVKRGQGEGGTRWKG